uniref:Uncharacterized protein LOC113789141 n=1 Tax=Dermatophagoides pteronyssinus TaxID=6956 RepID=A0A6P6XLY9_DERPT|nr:uncharacterized protein LOC113789141 [Dermatophagoides pteronyssinus]
MKFVKNSDVGFRMFFNQQQQQQKQEEKYAIIYPYDRLLYRQQLFGKHLLYVPTDVGEATFYIINLIIATSKQFPFRRQFDRIIGQLICTGIINRWKDIELRKARINRRFNINPNNDTDNTTEDNKQESINDIVPVKIFPKLTIKHLES